jgi:hypothetical protein
MSSDSAPSVESSSFSVPLTGLADQLRDDYWSAPPWPHVVVHGLFPEQLLDAAVAELRSVDRGLMEHAVTRRHVKQELHDVGLAGPATRAVLGLLESDAFVAFVRDLTGIPDLVTDPEHVGAGVHETKPGGFTMVHLDFPAHPFTRLHHRVNVLLYLNRDWHDEWGGHLELWPSDMKALGRRIPPAFNTLVVFATDAETRHGLPDAVACPEDMSRLSIASYLYSTQPPPRGFTRLATYRARPGDPSWVSVPMWRDVMHTVVPTRLRHWARRISGRGR